MRPLDLIWQQVQTGDRLGAKRELAGLLREEPGNVQGWLLMATLLDDPAQQAECYRKVLCLDPQNHRALTMLQQPVASEVPSREEVSVTPQSSSASVQIPELFDYTADGEVDEERLATLIREDLAKHVARELGSGEDRNALIRHVCETGDMSWPEAERLVARVALENEGAIAKRQRPLMLVLSAGTSVGGVILIFFSVYILFLINRRLDLAIYGIVTGLGMIGGGCIGLIRELRALRDSAL